MLAETVYRCPSVSILGRHDYASSVAESFALQCVGGLCVCVCGWVGACVCKLYTNYTLRCVLNTVL